MSKEMQRYVWELEKCTGCGACIACCSKGVLEFTEGHEHPVHKEIVKKVGNSIHKLDTCTTCDRFCEEVCPRMEEAPKGKMVSVVSTRTSLTSPRSRFGDLLSDVINQLMVSALESDFIDGAIIHDVDRWPWHTYARVVTEPEEIYICAGNQLVWSPVLTALNEAVYERGLERIAVVGSPCVISAARLIQNSELKGLEQYSKALRILVGTFCEGVVNYDIIPQMVEDNMGISPRSVARMDRSTTDRTLNLTQYDGNVREISLANVQRYLRKGCARCTDYLAESSDLSLGYPGSREGYVTIITWNSAGESLLRMGEITGHLEITKNVDTNRLLSAKQSKERRQRSQEYDRLLLEMLRGLSDEGSRSEALRKYLKLSRRGEE